MLHHSKKCRSSEIDGAESRVNDDARAWGRISTSLFIVGLVSGLPLGSPLASGAVVAVKLQTDFGGKRKAPG
jgi:hypothetical protein